jgi:hypothetical protein
MSVADDAVNAERLKKLLDESAAGRRPVSTSLGVLDMIGALRKEKEQAQARRLAQQEEQHAQMRAQAKRLSPAHTAVFKEAVQDAVGLLNFWHRGAVEGARAFRSTLVSDQVLVGQALVGNLVWAATAILSVPIKVTLSFLRTAADTLARSPSSYQDYIGPVTATFEQRLTAMRDELFTSMDVQVFPLLRKRGFDEHAADSRPNQLHFLWSGLFRVKAPPGQYDGPTQALIKSQLEAADADAVARLAALKRAWRASVVTDGADLQGVRFRWDATRWSQLTSDPVTLFTGRPVHLEVFRQQEEPFVDRNARAAALLRLAIDARFSAL